ncbi:MAG: 3'-phosphoesterase [Actinobacteria bacterium]|nr:3'-phosphoesterase [Actinomycetota bacterium]MBU1944389.1 3'-phosphoesterase [Actinomycetota bacterium]MBU2688832.1 3'-phosphoesterase [Actinomycetota bacterium]
MPLKEYRKKRDFARTPEPEPGAAEGEGRAFVIQKHAARRLHYDLRLEDSGVLKSWAVTREPPTEPGVKRLAVQVEDHPCEYKDFEGVIPEGEYGAGTVEIWDRGTYRPLLEGEPDRTVAEAIERGALKIELRGERLHGDYVLYHFDRDKGGRDWFFFRMKD